MAAEEQIFQFSESKIFNIGKGLILLAFLLGGWLVSIEMRQINRDKITAEQAKKIEKLENNYNTMNLLLTTDVAAIKSLLNSMQDDIKDIKKEQRDGE